MARKKIWPVWKVSGLRRRWITNTLIATMSLGIVCALVISTVFATRHYEQTKEKLQSFASIASTTLAPAAGVSNDQLYNACGDFAQSFIQDERVKAQFIDAGQLKSSSVVAGEGAPNTEDIADAVANGGIAVFVGEDEYAGCRVMAASVAMRYSDGSVAGVLRFVTPAADLHRQIVLIAVCAFLVLVLMAGVVFISSNYRIRSILVPLAQIVDKSRMIANGSYGIQIQADYGDEVGELASTINELSMKINQNEKVQTEFISNLSHELRTPLTAITGWSETLLSSDSLDQGTRRGVRIIHREAARLTEMVLDLLDFTRIQDGRMTLNMEMADIRSEFEDTVFMYGSRLAQEGITLEYGDTDEDVPEIFCDPKRLRQVFLNILDNAAKHGGDGKRIGTDIRCVDDNVVVRIRDYGCGIPEDELPLVTRKFYKGSSKARGSGIGLAVCDEIVQMHGGTLTLENALGGGTLVTVKLPINQ